MQRFGLFLLLGVATILSAQSGNEAVTPKDKDAEIKKAEELFAKGKANEALAALQEAAKKNPQLPPAKLMMSRLYLAAAMNNSNDAAIMSQTARLLLEQAISENADHPEVYLTNASVALGEGRLTETILNCSTALRLSENERWTLEQKRTFKREAHAGLATAFENRRDWTAAQAQLLAWKELEPKNPQVVQRLARVLFLRGSIEEAKATFAAAIALNPTLDPAELLIAQLYSGQQDRQNAEIWMKKALESHPKLPKVYQVYGGWLLDIGEAERAKPIIEEATKLDGKSREGKAIRGLLARYEKNYAQAEEIFEALTKENPADFFSSNQLALVLIESREARVQKRAVSIAEINAKSFDRINDVYATLAWCYFKVGRMEEAERVMQRVISSGQIMPDTAYYLAQILEAKEKFEEAYQLVNQSLESKSVYVHRQDAKKYIEVLKPKVPVKEKK